MTMQDAERLADAPKNDSPRREEENKQNWNPSPRPATASRRSSGRIDAAVSAAHPLPHLPQDDHAHAVATVECCFRELGMTERTISMTALRERGALLRRQARSGTAYSCGSRTAAQPPGVATAGTLTYGEVPPAEALRVIAAAGPKPGEIFCDLGSGRGQLVLAVQQRWRHVLKESRGVEALPGLVDLAVEAASRLEPQPQAREMLTAPLPSPLPGPSPATRGAATGAAAINAAFNAATGAADSSSAATSAASMATATSLAAAVTSSAATSSAAANAPPSAALARAATCIATFHLSDFFVRPDRLWLDADIVWITATCFPDEWFYHRGALAALLQRLKPGARVCVRSTHTQCHAQCMCTRHCERSLFSLARVLDCVCGAQVRADTQPLRRARPAASHRGF